MSRLLTPTLRTPTIQTLIEMVLVVALAFGTGVAVGANWTSPSPALTVSVPLLPPASAASAAHNTTAIDPVARYEHGRAAWAAVHPADDVAAVHVAASYEHGRAAWAAVHPADGSPLADN